MLWDYNADFVGFFRVWVMRAGKVRGVIENLWKCCNILHFCDVVNRMDAHLSPKASCLFLCTTRQNTSHNVNGWLSNIK